MVLEGNHKTVRPVPVGGCPRRLKSDFSSVVDNIVLDKDYRNALVQRGLANVAKFSVSAIAQQYGALYRRGI